MSEPIELPKMAAGDKPATPVAAEMPPAAATLTDTPAAAALAEAVSSAARAAGPAAPRRLAALPPISGFVSSAKRLRRPALYAFALAVALGLGWLGGTYATVASAPTEAPVPVWAEAAGAGIRQTRDGMTRLTGDVRALKGSVEGLKEGVDKSRAALAGQNKPVLDRLDGIDRSLKDTSAKLARVAETTERGDGEAAAKLAQLSERLERLEKQAAATLAARAAPADGPTQTGSIAEPKKEPAREPAKEPVKEALAKDLPLEGWALREVYDGGALVQARNGRLYEVAPGRNLPGIGRVDAIERRGKSWVVVTAKGIIGNERWQ